MTSDILVMEALTVLLQIRGKSAKGCTKETCPVQDSIYEYYLSLPISAILAALFAISLFLHVFQGFRAKSWSFMTALAIGTTLEVIGILCIEDLESTLLSLDVGYVGRILLRNDVFSRAYIGIQLICLTVAPASLSAGIYLTLKHITIIYGRKFSRLAPKSYTRIFITCDIISILIQTAGTTMAASASASSSDTGITVILIGLITQAITLSIFGLLALDVLLRIRRHSSYQLTTTKHIHNTTFTSLKNIILAIGVAYVLILIRCVYRVPEMAGGWSNKVMQDQVLFILLDGMMCVLAVMVLNVWHPGVLFANSDAMGKMAGVESVEVPMIGGGWMVGGDGECFGNCGNSVLFFRDNRGSASKI